MTATKRVTGRRAAHALASALVALCVSTLITGGCGSPVYAGGPSPLRGTSSLAVVFDYSGLMVAGLGAESSEADWVAARSREDPGYAALWDDLKKEWEAQVLFGLTQRSPVPVHVLHEHEAPPADTAVLTMSLKKLHMGKWFVRYAPPSWTETLQVWSRSGQVVEERSRKTSVRPSLRHPSIFQHMAPLGRGQGGYAGRYLKDALNS